MMYFIAALAASAAFIAAGWRSRQATGLAPAHVWYGTPTDPLWVEPEIETMEVQADAGAALWLVLKRLAPIMASRSVQADIAAPVGLLVRMRAAALVDLLEELLAVVLHSAPASRILLTAAAHGERIYISVSDDMLGADADVRRAGMRELTQRIAMRGGVLDVDVRPAEGTTMTLRLPAVRTDGAGRVIAKSAKAPTTMSIPLFSSDMSH